MIHESLGERVKGDKPTDKNVGAWFRSMGIKTVSERVQVNKNGGGPDLDLIYITNNKRRSGNGAKTCTDLDKTMEVLKFKDLFLIVNSS